MSQPFVITAVDTPAGQIPLVASALSPADHWGGIKARWDIGRMDYTVLPGLYGVGNPDAASEVLVSANYKLSFDALRSVLTGRSAWILVLDTKGINVWCAAGKKTFGTSELVSRIVAEKLPELVSHRRLIVPQLGAPGIAAHLVKKESGFKVIYGPIMATDLPAFLDSGLAATPEMRLKLFPFMERITLIPVELVHAMKWALAAAALLAILAGFARVSGDFAANAAIHGKRALFAILAGVMAGAVLAPALLPWLPGRAFAVKGLGSAGLAILATLPFFFDSQQTSLATDPGWLAHVLTVGGISSFLAMNFTGASTYTSLSGVKKEMRYAVPLQIVALLAGFALWAVGVRTH